MEQTKYNKLLEEEFAKGGRIIAVGEILTQEAWDRIISGANFAADNFATEVARSGEESAAMEGMCDTLEMGMNEGVLNNPENADLASEIAKKF